MRFYDWRKGITARLLHPYRYENPRWNRTVFVPKGTTFQTVHARRGPPERFGVPADIIDDVHLYESNMSPSQAKLFPEANFMFHVDDTHSLYAEIVDESNAAEEFFAVEKPGQVETAIPYLSQGKAVNYLVQLVNNGYGDALLMHRVGDVVERLAVSPRWHENVRRVVKVKEAIFPVKSMKSRIKQNLHPIYDFRWFVATSLERPVGKGKEACKEIHEHFRSILTSGALSGHYLTEGFRNTTNGTDLISLYAFVHNHHDLTLLRIAYADRLNVLDLDA